MLQGGGGAGGGGGGGGGGVWGGGGGDRNKLSKISIDEAQRPKQTFER